MIGKIKWYNEEKGYGFIEPEAGGKDVFVHVKAVKASGANNLIPGQRIRFDIAPGKKGPTAINLREPS